ncbi:MAG: TetR family transcriptional regulator [Burkholderiales bacterium]|nr:TetR family transcriptional regulator [Burkholderiales bacterium]
MAAAPKAKTSKALVAVKRPGVRVLAAQATREGILKAAIKVFAKSGFAGGRVEKISKAARSFDRMIYYYFGSKEGLFIAALEEIYRRFCEAEAKVDLDMEQPVESLKTVVLFTWNYYQKHPEFITLLNSENLHRGVHISKSMRAREYSGAAISILDQVLRSGISKGVFRADVQARDLYLMISSLCYFYLSNRFTLSAFLGQELEVASALSHWESFVTDAVLRVVAPA